MHLFSIWDNVEEANAAAEAIRSLKEDYDKRISVVLHEDHIKATENIQFSETNVKDSVKWGTLIGGTGGAVLAGVAAGPLALFGMGPLFAAMLGGAHGGLLGALQGALSGTIAKDSDMQKLVDAVEKEGKVLLSVEVKGLTPQAEVESILQEHGALDIQGFGWPDD